MMFAYLLIISIFLISVRSIKMDIIEQDYCYSEYFNPTCPVGEIILMTYAHYGQMSLGRCLEVDRGEVGCQADVLPQFDSKCSARKSCNVMVSNRFITTSGGCGKGLLLYLRARYMCVKELDLGSCSSSPENKLQIDSQEVFITSDKIRDQCLQVDNQVILKVEEGQTMNISIINFEQANHDDSVYGSLVDSTSSTNVVFGDGPRNKYLSSSTTNEVQLSVQSRTASFILHIQVQGCQTLQPPSGAWMTRNGDVMEVGCHSGAKSWSLHCEENQWVGTVGQCGESYETKDDVRYQKTVVKERDDSLSPDTALFGISSLVIFVSAVIFLIGVCVLKRKMGASVAYKSAMCETDSFPYSNIDVHGRALNEISANHTEKENYGRNTLQGTYMNSSGVPDEASVKYFVLENK